jgi:tetratricopeptide (TPR) repeat protein
MASDRELGAMVSEGEEAHERGDAARAFAVLAEASEQVNGDEPEVPRLVDALVATARIVGAQARVVEWIERVLPTIGDPRSRAALLRGAMSMWSRLDTARALALEPEASAAAEAIRDEDGLASVLALAGFVAYRRGEVKRCREIADRAKALTPESRTAQYQLTRAQMFAATTAGELEAGLNLTMKARALARELGRLVDIANESNNLAETYLELGYPHEAKACAEAGEKLSRQVGHVANTVWAQVYGATASAEAGDVDGAIAILDSIEVQEQFPIAMIDAAHAHAYWLLERGAAGDAARARERAQFGIELAERSGSAHRLCALHASLARSLAREANLEAARAHLEKARRDLDKVEPTAHSLLALASAEVMSASEAPRHVVLMSARTRILRAAARREDPHAFCTHVRVNRRLLELTGGVPSDLPHAS